MAGVGAIAGVILAGGLSRRMGGGDKGLIQVGGSSLLGRVVACLSPQVSMLLINANGDPARFRTFGLPIAPDPVSGFVGPLAGVLAGLHWAASREADARPTHIVTASTDTPFLPDDLVERLIAAREAADSDIVLARSDDGLHPVIGLWPVALAADLETALAHGVRKVLDWTSRHRVTEASFPLRQIAGQVVDPFFNANTPDDIAVVERLLGMASDWQGSRD
ncbi:MAG: molybdenum cofactor guanylyltransferase MobA [Hyphomicrobiaceae bacterium]